MSDRLAYIILSPLIILVVVAIVDLFVRKDIPTGKKLLWGLVVVVFPGIGPLVYLLARYRVFQALRRSMS
ncbi:MAG: PLDc N-terminal domain-containing protein [Dehalococcoidia bacterium]